MKNGNDNLLSNFLFSGNKKKPIELKVVVAESYSQIQAQDELGLFVKNKTIETWDKLVYWLSVYLEEVRKRGGTMGHKVGNLRDQQIGLKEMFENF